MKSIEEQTREAAEKHYTEWNKYPSNGVKEDCMDDFIAGAEWERSREKWISVEDRPLFTTDERGNWVCTEDGDGEFIAAISYVMSYFPGKVFWWIKHCVVEDEIGLCVVGDDDNEPAGWNLKDVEYYIPLPEPPKQKEEK